MKIADLLAQARACRNGTDADAEAMGRALRDAFKLSTPLAGLTELSHRTAVMAVRGPDGAGTCYTSPRAIVRLAHCISEYFNTRIEVQLDDEQVQVLIVSLQAQDGGGLDSETFSMLGAEHGMPEISFTAEPKASIGTVAKAAAQHAQAHQAALLERAGLPGLLARQMARRTGPKAPWTSTRKPQRKAA